MEKLVEMRKNVLFIDGRPVSYTQIDSRYTEDLPAKLKDRAFLATENLDGHAHAVMSIPSIRAARDFRPVTVPANS